MIARRRFRRVWHDGDILTLPAFLSPEAVPASSPHQSIRGGFCAFCPFLRFPRPPTRSDSDSATNTPASCPTCQSSSILTTAKVPDSNSYWRCQSCGEIWNGARHHGPRRENTSWR